MVGEETGYRDGKKLQDVGENRHREALLGSEYLPRKGAAFPRRHQSSQSVRQKQAAGACSGRRD